MTRAPLSYSMHPTERTKFVGIDVTEPHAGFYRTRLVSGGVAGGVRIWFGPPKDPATGEEMDRSWRWQAEFDGEYADFDRLWPQCAGEPISEEEYRRYCARKTWAQQHAPNSAYADRTKKIDRLSTDNPLPF